MTTNTGDVRPLAADPYADRLPHCTAFPADTPLADLLPDLVGTCLAVDDDQHLPERYVVVVDCLHSARNIAPARLRFPGRPIVAAVARPDADQVCDALRENAEGIVCLGDPAVAWRDCVNVVLGGGRWLDGPGVEVLLEHKYTRYGIARGVHQTGDVTMRTQTFVRQSVRDKLQG